MYCKECGAETLENAAFCTVCGAPINAEEVEATPEATSTTVLPPAQTPTAASSASPSTATATATPAIPAATPAATPASPSTTPSAGGPNKITATIIPCALIVIAALIIGAVLLLGPGQSADDADPASTESLQQQTTEEPATATEEVVPDATEAAAPANEGTTPSTPQANATIPGTFKGITEASATSTLPTSGVNYGNYSASSAIDGNIATCWCENVEGNGIGESITLWGAEPQAFNGFTIWPGLQESESLFYKNARPKTLEVYVDGNYYYTAHLSDNPGSQTFQFNDGLIEGYKITFKITAVYPGNKYTDCCISEIAVF